MESYTLNTQRSPIDELTFDHLSIDLRPASLKKVWVRYTGATTPRKILIF